MSCLWKKFVDEMLHWKIFPKKHLVGDQNISDIFYKFQNLNGWPVFQVITHWTYTCLSPLALRLWRLIWPKKSLKYETSLLLQLGLSRAICICLSPINWKPDQYGWDGDIGIDLNPIDRLKKSQWPAKVWVKYPRIGRLYCPGEPSHMYERNIKNVFH